MAKAEVEVIVKGKDQASSVLRGIGKAAKGLGIGVAAVGVAAVGMGVASVKSFADAGDAVHKMALRTGFGTESLSELKHAMDLSGGSIEGLEVGLKKMARFVDDARQGLSTATDVLSQLGVSAEELKGLKPEEAFNKLSMAIADMGDPLAKQNAALEVFGRAGTDLLPMLKDGADGLAAMKQEAHDLGIVFDQEAADSAAEFKDNITRLQGSFQGLMNEIAKALMPVLEALIPILTEIIKSLPIEQFSKLISTLLPPLVDLFLDLMDAVPLESMLKFIVAVLEPLMKILAVVIRLAAPLLRLLEPVFELLTLIMEVLDPIIEGLTWIIDKLATGLGGFADFVVGGLGSVFDGINLQAGGVVTGPTSALIGEAGPEAVIPLERMGGFGETNIYVNVEGSVITEDQLSDAVYEKLLKRKERNFSLELG